MCGSPPDRAASWAALLLGLLALSQPAGAGGPGEFGGHLKYRLSGYDFPADAAFAGPDDPYTEQTGNLRLNYEARSGAWDARVHYSLGVLYSEDLATCRFRGGVAGEPGCLQAGSDAGQLFDLAQTISVTDDSLVVHRLDRLSLGWSSGRNVLRFGRQAISWGNGVAYQPLDIFNPFAPDEIDTDYKPGLDMLYGQHLLPDGHDLQALVIPRRSLESGEVRSDESTLAGKLHWFGSERELDLVLARHYADDIVGGGVKTDWAGNMLQADLSLTRTGGETVLLAVANYNYSAIAAGRNLTGYVEFFYNGFGLHGSRNGIADLLADDALLTRLLRGELYTIGRWYLSTGVSVEVTPLLLLSPVVFVNLGDRSGLLQVVANYSLAQDLDLLAGFSLAAGPAGTEFGGIFGADADDGPLTPPQTLFARLAWYF